MKKLLSLVLILVVLCSCGGSYSFENIYYPDGSIIDYVMDDDMVLDGKNLEGHYKGLSSFDIYDPENDVTMSTYIYYGENGWYFYSYVNDKSVMYSENKQLYQNDGIELHLCVNPNDTINIENLKKSNKILDTMVQIRISVGGDLQTWVGNYLANSYEWTMYYIPCKTEIFVDGVMNKNDAANGYGVETYVPYSAFGLETSPEEISIMPAFNNCVSNLDTSIKWFTRKGMAHNYPSSWARYNENDGFIYDGKDVLPLKEIKALESDYDGQVSKEIYEVDENNQNPVLRGYFKSYFDESGIYLLAVVYDKFINRYNDSVWNNDGVEFMIDTNHNPGNDTCLKDGVYRFGFDVDNGVETDFYMNGFGYPVPYYYETHSMVNVSYLDNPIGEYKYKYVYELFVSYDSLRVSNDFDYLYVNFAIKTPYETTYILDRKDGSGRMEGQDWLWIDKHYPQNTLEFFKITEEGLL